jgi:SAM-dependent methyltransferase
MDVQSLYRVRFSPQERATKDRVWAVLCSDFFHRFIAPTDRVLEVAAGYCEFINHVRCAEKYAIDLNPDVAAFAGRDVRAVVGSCLDMSMLPQDHFDAVFVSNFLEHLENRREVGAVLREIRERLRPGGRLLILQPNIRYLGARYWDFYDHVTPLTHVSLREALELHGYAVECMIPRFLPYTFKSRVPKATFLVKAYLRCPPAQWVLGKQTFACAVKRRFE